MLPYLAGLFVLAFALASLSRGTSGGSFLFRAYWLLYLVYLGPIIILGVLVALVVLIGLNYRDIGAGIGFGMAQRRKKGKSRGRYSTIIAMFFWALAIYVLFITKGTIFNPTHAANSTLANIVGVNATAAIPIQVGFLPVLSSLVQNSWFSLAFLGLIVVGGLVVIQSIRASFKEMQEMKSRELQGNREEGLQAVHEAIKLIDDPRSDPRSRIIACYQHLIMTASRLGAPVSSSLTARELDRAIRITFALTGPATTELTQLFEEARYSLHEISDDDANSAREYLESVAEELKIQLQTET